MNELKEAWEGAPVTIIYGENAGSTVVIEYDENSLATDITINGQPFDTSRINDKEIEDWVYPFMMRKVKSGTVSVRNWQRLLALRITLSSFPEVIRQ